MSTHTVYKLHSGRVLWPEHKSEAEVLELQRTTPEYIWETTYQSNPVDPSGNVFKREWWDGKNRYGSELPIPIARYISIDTATSEEESSAFTAYCVFNLLPDYRLTLAEVGRKRVEFPELVRWITSIYNRYQTTDNLLRNIVVEDASSGKQLLQTLRKAGGDLAYVLTAFQPRVEKYARWGMAAVWCRNDMILFPTPGIQYPWLLDFEDELFSVPGAVNLDQADSFSQGIIFLENILSEGYKARSHL